MINRILLLTLSAFIGLTTIAQIPTNGLVAFYPFNGNANDESVNKCIGAVVGAQLTADRFGTKNSAYKFNGLDQYIQIADNDAFSISSTGKLSISVWMKCDTLDFPNTEGDGYLHWMGKGNSNNQEWCFRIYNNNHATRSNRTSCYAFNLLGGLGAGSYVQETISTSEWIHIVAIYNYPSNLISIYKNGALKHSANFSDYFIVPANGLAPLRVGTRDLLSFFKGSIDDIRIYNRVLNLTEIESLYNEVGLIGTTGENLTIHSTINIYPNPTFDKITVDLGSEYSKSGNYKVKILNLLGQNVYSGILNQTKTEVNLQSFNNTGIYVVYITDANNNVVGVKKINLQI